MMTRGTTPRSGVTFDALDSLPPGEVHVFRRVQPVCPLGGLMSTRAMRCGGVVAVLEGYGRDTRGIETLNFPVFSYGVM